MKTPESLAKCWCYGRGIAPCLVLLVAFACIAECPSLSCADQKALVRGSGVAEAPAQEIGAGDLYAILVGVSTYKSPKIPALQVSDKDARDFAEFLESQRQLFRNVHIELLLNEQATQREVKKRLLYRLREAGKDDSVVLFFSGHGASDPTMPGEYFFITYDADPEFLGASAINLSSMSFLRRLDAKRVLLIADTCQAGGFSMSDTKSLQPSLETFVRQFKESEGKVLLSSCRSDEVSLERVESGNSLFTHSLLAGLRGEADLNQDNVVTLREAYEFVYATTKNESKGVQHPQMEGKVTGAFPLSFVHGDQSPMLELRTDPPEVDIYLSKEANFRSAGTTDVNGRLLLRGVSGDEPVLIMARKRGWRDKIVGPIEMGSREAIVKQPVIKLEPSVATLVLRTDEPDVHVSLDGASLGKTGPNGLLLVKDVRVDVPQTYMLAKDGVAPTPVEIVIPAQYDGKVFTSSLCRLPKPAEQKVTESTASRTEPAPSRGAAESAVVAVTPESAPESDTDTEQPVSPPSGSGKANGKIRSDEAVVKSVDQPDKCLRIRSGPSSSTDKVGCVALHGKVRLTGRRTNDNWVEIDQPTNGWVYARQLSMAPGKRKLVRSRQRTRPASTAAPAAEVATSTDDYSKGGPQYPTGMYGQYAPGRYAPATPYGNRPSPGPYGRSYKRGSVSVGGWSFFW